MLIMLLGTNYAQNYASIIGKALGGIPIEVFG